MPTQPRHPPVAIIGVSALFPDSEGTAPFWKNILDGRDLITDVPPSHWLQRDYYDPEPGDADKTYCKRGGFLPDVDFDPVEYGIPPNAIPATDTTQLLALIAARKVLEDAYSTQFHDVDKRKMSIILGVTAGQELLIQSAARLQRPQWQAALREHGLPEPEVQSICDRIADQYTPWQESTFPGLLGNVVAGRIANRFDLGGTNCITDAACASSLSALSMALDELYLGHSDVVITGGVDCFNDIFMYMCFTKTPALSPTGDCRPFSDRADGTLLGEGLGMFALKRLDEAEEDGDCIYGVVRGLGSSSDGRSLSVYAPLPEGQATALKRAHDRAGICPETVELIEAHGTATKAGDVAEFKGLCHAFCGDDASVDSPWCALGSIKSQIGHTKAAAGAASLFKSVMALHHKTLPPTIKVDEPNSKLFVDDSPFYVNTEARPWIRGGDHPRRAGVSSFGFGGSNFHVVVEEYTGDGATPPRMRTFSSELFVWSAPTANQLVDKLHTVLDHLDDPPQRPGDYRLLLARIARTAQRDFDAEDDHRLAFVAGDIDELSTLLARAVERVDDGEFDLPGGLFYRHQTRSTGDIGLLFPGQGSQYVSMGAELAMHFDAARRVWDEAADLDFDLADRVFPPPAFDEKTTRVQNDTLTATEWAQPAIGADSAARWAVLEDLGIEPAAVAGHSYGEITALYAAGVFDRTTMLRIARRRGQLMAEASESTDGAMTAVRADAATVTGVLDGKPITIANDNGPHQVVVSGPTEAVEAAESTLRQQGFELTRLSVDTAFHSPVVADATTPFAEFLDGVDIATPHRKVYANATAAPYDSDADAIRTTLTSQIERPVRFAEMVAAMHSDGIDTFVEVGPGDVLAGLASRCLQESGIETVAVDRRHSSDIEAFFAALAKLSVLGVEMDFSALWKGYAEPRDPRTDERSNFTVTINGANVDRPYPPPEGPEAVPAPNPPEKTDATSTNDTPDSPSSNGSPSLNGKAPDHGAFMSDSNNYTNGRAHDSPSPQNTDGAPRKAGGRAHEQPRPQQPPSQPSSNSQPVSQPTPQDPPPGGPEHARAFTEYQRSLAESHQAYLRMMEESVSQAQMAYMQAMESSFRQWCKGGRADDGQPIRDDRSQSAVDGNTQQSLNPHRRTASPQSLRATDAPTTPTHPSDAPTTPAHPSDAPTTPAPPSDSPPAGANPSVPASPEESVETTPNIPEVFLDVTAEKTGYPPDMLDDSMALEADLGIDSIKRVEILSAVQQKVPSLPELDPNEMASLKTVGEIVDYLSNHTDDDHQPSAGGPPGEPTPRPNGAISADSGPPEAGSSSSEASISSVFMDVTAEKTGYPPDMLDDSMALEADLGIDSIKRVEILSAVQQKVPSLPELDPNEMASLKTVGEIVDYLESFDSGPPPADPTTGGDRLGKAEAAVEPARYEPGLAAAKPAGINRLTPSSVTIVDDGGGVGAALARQLGSRGYTATLVDDVDGDKTPAQVVDLRGLRPLDSIDDALDIQRQVFRTARAVGSPVDTFVVVFDTGGGFGLDDSDGDDVNTWLGGLSALAKTAALEWLDAEVQAIDVATGEIDASTVAERIADELTAGGPEPEVAIDSAGTRHAVITERSEINADDSAAPITDRDVVVASGGARGVTAHCLVELARQTGCAIALVGRTPLGDEPDGLRKATTDAEIKRTLIQMAKARGESPDLAQIGARAALIKKRREIRETIDAIEDAGAPVCYLSADVTDRDALSEALGEVRDRFGAPTALVHAAGVLADKHIEDKTDEQFDFVFGTKVDGLRALLDVAEDDPVDSVCVFSSVAARTGNPGQVDYAMANETLNKVVGQLADDGIDASALQWGPWDGGMVDDTLRKHFQERGVSLIEPRAGARAFVREMTTDTDTAEVVLGDGLVDADTGLTTRVCFDSISHPELTGHAIDGAEVVPLARIADLFAGLARVLRPDEHLAELSDLQMLEGIRLSEFDDPATTTRFSASAVDDDDASTLLTLRGPAGDVFYRATARFAEQPPGPTLLDVPDAFDAPIWDADTLYDDVLFHGGDFQVLEDVEGIGGDAARAEVTPSKPHVVLDAGLQLALAQGAAADGQNRQSLPTRIARYIDCGINKLDGPLEIRCVTREITAHKTVSDFDVVDEHGQIVAAVRGLEMYFR